MHGVTTLLVTGRGPPCTIVDLPESLGVENNPDKLVSKTLRLDL